MTRYRPITSTDLPVLVCAFDDTYAMSAAAMLKSVESNLATYEQIRVCVLESTLSLTNRARIEASLDLNRVDLAWVTVGVSTLADLKVGLHVSTATYYRLLIADLLPDVDRAIYLDSDVIVCGDLGQLWNTPLHGAHLLAAPQVSPDASLASSARG